MERTPESTLKARVSCESSEVPEYQPFHLLRFQQELERGYLQRGDGADDHERSGREPGRQSPPVIASALVTVASITLAPPKLQQLRRRILRGTVDVVPGTELSWPAVPCHFHGRWRRC